MTGTKEAQALTLISPSSHLHDIFTSFLRFGNRRKFEESFMQPGTCTKSYSPLPDTHRYSIHASHLQQLLHDIAETLQQHPSHDVMHIPLLINNEYAGNYIYIGNSNLRHPTRRIIRFDTYYGDTPRVADMLFFQRASGIPMQ